MVLKKEMQQRESKHKEAFLPAYDVLRVLLKRYLLQGFIVIEWKFPQNPLSISLLKKIHCFN